MGGTAATVARGDRRSRAGKCDLEVILATEPPKFETEIPFLYALNYLLCVQCLATTSSIANSRYIPCCLFSKHYSAGYPAKIIVNMDGIHLTGRSQPETNSLLINWSCILRWQCERLTTASSVFRVYIVGLVHPQTPDDPDVSKAFLNQHLSNGGGADQEPAHSFEINGFAHDASLDFCCLAIFVNNRRDCDTISIAFQTHALCHRKKRVQRPLLLFVNKMSGQGRAEKVLFDVASPLLSFSGCTFDVVNTEHNGHAYDYIKALPLSDLKKYRALVYVSGDGILHELINGLFSRDDVAEFPPLACIPAGSGNAMASAICYRSGISTGRNFLRSCCILLALPNSPDIVIPRQPVAPFQLQSYWQTHKPMVVEADNWTGPRMCSGAVTWGLVSEVDLRSDFMRCVGSVRFQIMFLYLLITGLKKYRCEFGFLLSKQDEAVMKKLKSTFGDRLLVASGKTAPFGNDSADHPEALMKSRKRYLPDVEESLPEDQGWIRVKSQFLGLNFLKISHLAADNVCLAESGLDSDHIVVHLMPSDMPRSELIRLMKIGLNGHPMECAKTGIILHVKAFRITLDEESAKSPYMWSLDGEPFGGMRIFQGEVYSQGYRILALPPVQRNPFNHAPDFF
ncbi:hypothetical protein Aperf_G00000019558 [Anoplocephala perfoliata]